MQSLSQAAICLWGNRTAPLNQASDNNLFVAAAVPEISKPYGDGRSRTINVSPAKLHTTLLKGWLVGTIIFIDNTRIATNILVGIHEPSFLQPISFLIPPMHPTRFFFLVVKQHKKNPSPSGVFAEQLWCTAPVALKSNWSELLNCICFSCLLLCWGLLLQASLCLTKAVLFARFRSELACLLFYK